jgi:uncharacterized membrane protein
VRLDNRLAVATPEGVTLELVLAGLGSRFVARLLDSLIQFGIIVVLLLAGGAVGVTPGIGLWYIALLIPLIFLVIIAYDVPYIIGSISIVSSDHEQRLGDLAAGTVVARERFGADKLPAPVAALSVPVESVLTWDVSAVDLEEIQVMRHFLDRRLALPWPVRMHFGTELVHRVWGKVPGLPNHVHPEYILEGIVVAKQARA